MHEKGVLRALVRQARATRRGSQIGPAVGLQLPTWQRVGAYRALDGEPDLAPLLASLPTLTVLLPRIEESALSWVVITPTTEFEPGPFGIQQPVGADATAMIADVDALLMPALAVDITGRRLGQGGGYYDRLLAMLPPASDGGPVRVAVVHDDEVLREIPDEPHDARVDAILTPTRYITLT
jgi:5-formyltetrahydrofolate cyclo-ligase